MVDQHRDFELDECRERLQMDRVHAWLASSYWSPGVERRIVDRAFANSSLVVGCYVSGTQIGVLRVVSDRATFAWICDVWVDVEHRGNGIARAMVRYALADPDHSGLRRWLLATRDAHGVYSRIGFVVDNQPALYMVHRPASAAKQTT